MGVGKAAAERTAEARSAEALWGNLMERKILTVARCPKRPLQGSNALRPSLPKRRSLSICSDGPSDNMEVTLRLQRSAKERCSSATFTLERGDQNIFELREVF
jgi:hypothetical protein